jgi:hypothetical protein
VQWNAAAPRRGAIGSRYYSGRSWTPSGIRWTDRHAVAQRFSAIPRPAVTPVRSDCRGDAVAAEPSGQLTRFACGTTRLNPRRGEVAVVLRSGCLGVVMLRRRDVVAVVTRYGWAGLLRAVQPAWRHPEVMSIASPLNVRPGRRVNASATLVDHSLRLRTVIGAVIVDCRADRIRAVNSSTLNSSILLTSARVAAGTVGSSTSASAMMIAARAAGSPPCCRPWTG